MSDGVSSRSISDKASSAGRKPRKPGEGRMRKPREIFERETLAGFFWLSVSSRTVRNSRNSGHRFRTPSQSPFHRKRGVCVSRIGRRLPSELVRRRKGPSFSLPVSPETRCVRAAGDRIGKRSDSRFRSHSSTTVIRCLYVLPCFHVLRWRLAHRSRPSIAARSIAHR